MKRFSTILGTIWVSMLIGFAAPVPAAEPIRIGAIFSVTGPASFLGEPERNTAKMLEEEINKAGGLLGRKIELIVYDDESDTTKAVTAVDRLVKRDRVVAVIGPSTSGSTLAIVPKIEEAQIPLVSCAAARKIVEPVRRWVFKVAASDILAARKIFADLKQRDLTKVAILTASDAYGAGGREDIKEIAPQMGIALVADEFGSIAGLVTMNDVMEAIVGEFPSQGERAKPVVKKRDDGSWLIDAMIDLDAVEKALPGFRFDGGAHSEYQTLAGFVVKTLGHVPKEGETFEAQGYIFEVLDMDRHRVDKVLVMQVKPAPQPSQS